MSYRDELKSESYENVIIKNPRVLHKEIDT